MAELDMKTPIFNREEINAFIKSFGLLTGKGEGMPREWTIHVGPQTIVRMTFTGPVGADEWDSLLAHIAFYKQWYKDAPTTNLLNMNDAVTEVMKRLEAKKSEQATTD